MVTPPFISVIVPTHNRLQTLEGLIECLSSQNYPTELFEIIIVDDGSTDGTPARLQHWAATGKLSFVTQDQHGPGSARNLGAQMARGQVLAFTDSDCLPEPGWLSALAEEYKVPGRNAVTAVGGPINNSASGSWLRKFQARRGSDHTANHHASPLYLDTANASFLKTVFLSLGGFNLAYSRSEDVDLGFRLRRAGFQLRTAPSAVVWHVGTTSWTAYLQRSYRIGYAKGRLAADYPEVFYPLPPPGVRYAMRNWLERHIQLDSLSPAPRSMRFMLSRLIYDLAQLLTWEKGFWFDTIPKQANHYRSQQINGVVIVFYLFLEWICHLAHLTGLFSQNLKVTFHRGSTNAP